MRLVCERGRLIVAENFAEYRQVIAHVTQASDCVLEVGCGCGVTTALLAQHCRRVIGVDRSHKVISAARQRFPHVEFHLLDATDLTALAALLQSPDDVRSSSKPFDAVFVDINGSRELQTLLPLLEAYDAALRPPVLVVKNRRLKRLLLRAEHASDCMMDGGRRR